MLTRAAVSLLLLSAAPAPAAPETPAVEPVFLKGAFPKLRMDLARRWQVERPNDIAVSARPVATAKQAAVQIGFQETKHITPRALVTVTGGGGTVLAAFDVGVFPFEPEGFLARRLDYLLIPAFAKARAEGLRSVALEIDAPPDFLTALRHRLDAEDRLAGRDLAQLRLPTWHRGKLPVLEKPDIRITGSYRKGEEGISYAIKIHHGGDDPIVVSADNIVSEDDSEIRVAEAVAEALRLHFDRPSTWDRGQEIAALVAESRWAADHGLAIEGALGSDRLWALGKRDVETAERRLRSHSMAAALYWRDLHNYGPYDLTRGGGSGSRYAGQAIDVANCPGHLASAIAAVRFLPEYFARNYGEEEDLPFLLNPQPVGMQVLLYGTRILRTCELTGHGSPAVEELRAALIEASAPAFRLRDRYRERHGKVGRFCGASFFGRNLFECIPWWYPDLGERFAAYREYFRTARPITTFSLYRYFKPGFRELRSDGWGLYYPPELRSSGRMFPERALEAEEAEFDVQWVRELFRISAEDTDWETQATAWCLLAALAGDIDDPSYQFDKKRHKAIQDAVSAMDPEAFEDWGLGGSVWDRERTSPAGRAFKAWVNKGSGAFLRKTESHWFGGDRIPAAVPFLWTVLGVDTASYFPYLRRFQGELNPNTVAFLVGKKIPLTRPFGEEGLQVPDPLAGEVHRWLRERFPPPALGAKSAGSRPDPLAAFLRENSSFETDEEKEARLAEKRRDRERKTPDTLTKETRENAPPVEATAWRREDPAAPGKSNSNVPADFWKEKPDLVRISGGKVWYGNDMGFASVEPAEGFRTRYFPFPTELREKVANDWRLDPFSGDRAIINDVLVIGNDTRGLLVWKLGAKEWQTHRHPERDPEGEDSLHRLFRRPYPTSFGLVYLRSGVMESATHGQAAFVRIGGGARLFDPATRRSEILFESRRFPPTNNLEGGSCVWPSAAFSPGGHLVVDCVLDHGNGGRYFFTRQPDGNWLRGIDISPPHHERGSRTSARGRRLYVYSRTGVTGWSGIDIAEIDPADPRRARCVYRSNEPGDDGVDAFPDAGKPAWAGIGYRPPNFDSDEDGTVFFREGFLGKIRDGDAGGLRWFKIVPELTPEERKPPSWFISTRGNSIRVIDGGYVVGQSLRESFYFIPKEELK